MSYEIRNEKVCGRLTPSERRALIYEKEPVEELADLWEKYPTGGHAGWYCLIKSKHALYAWNEEVNDWTELGTKFLGLEDKHDKKNGMLMRLLNPGDYSEQDGVVPGEIFIVPMAEGDYTFFISQYPRNRQSIQVDEIEVGQVIIYAEAEKWRKQLLPVYDYIQETLIHYQHNRGVVLNSPDEVEFIPEPKENDYVYYKDDGSDLLMMWVYNGKKWVKTSISMPKVEISDLTEYAKHGYKAGERQKTVAEVDKQMDSIRSNVDGGNASSYYGGCLSLDGGNSETEV